MNSKTYADTENIQTGDKLISRFNTDAAGCRRINKLGLPKTATIKKEDIFSAAMTGATTPVFSAQKCNQCLECVVICPTNAVKLQKNKQLQFELDKCIGCRACADACSTKAIVAGPSRAGSPSRRELALNRAEKRTYQKKAIHGNGKTAKNAEAKSLLSLKKTIKIFSRSVSAREVDCGSCNACELEIAAICNPVYDAERFGMHIVASPRHADVLLTTGPVTRQMELALRKTDDATPSPKLIIAVGTCACSGGMFAESPVAGDGVGSVLKVDYYIPGCPPSPQAILKSIADLRNL